MPDSRPSCSAGATIGVSVLNAGVCRDEPIARRNSDAMISHTGACPSRAAMATTRLMAAMNRSEPIRVAVIGCRSTMTPANGPISASGRNPAMEASVIVPAEPPCAAICQISPICTMELVNTEKSSPPHTMAMVETQAYGRDGTGLGVFITNSYGLVRNRDADATPRSTGPRRIRPDALHPNLL